MYIAGTSRNWAPASSSNSDSSSHVLHFLIKLESGAEAPKPVQFASCPANHQTQTNKKKKKGEREALFPRREAGNPHSPL